VKVLFLPVYFRGTNDRGNAERGEQLVVLEKIYGEEAEFLPEREISGSLPEKAGALLFSQLLGEIFSRTAELERIRLPVVVLTSSFVWWKCGTGKS
jgi:hypothetical protein